MFIGYTLRGFRKRVVLAETGDREKHLVYVPVDFCSVYDCTSSA